MEQESPGTAWGVQSELMVELVMLSVKSGLACEHVSVTSLNWLLKEGTSKMFQLIQMNLPQGICIPCLTEPFALPGTGVICVALCGKHLHCRQCSPGSRLSAELGASL